MEKQRQQIGFTVKQINNIYEKDLNERIKKLSITSSQCAVLDFLFHTDKDEVNQCDVEKALSLKNPTVTGILKRLDENGFINRNRMAAMIFSDSELLSKVNAIIHPAVKDYILSEIQKEKDAGNYDFFFVEAALLIECGYGAHVDELWYIYASEDIRRKRLIESRGYSEEKISQIMRGQLQEEEFRKACHVVIDNSHDLEITKKQIDKILGEKLWKVQENILDN